jgi:Aspartyl protease
MKNYFTLYVILSVHVSFGQTKLIEGNLINKRYIDTIKCENKFGLKTLQVKVNGRNKTLIFDTGADIILLSKDSSTSRNNLNSQVTDANGKSSKSSLVIIEEFKIRNLTYSNLNSLRIGLPSPLVCISDGLMGNNVIKKSNWKITKDYIIASNNPFKNTEVKWLKFFYFASNSIYSNISLDGIAIDTCLIDYGSRSEIELPMKFYEKFNNNSKNINKRVQKISSRWTVNGKTIPDTTLILNCNLNFFNVTIDSINVVFSNRIKRPKLGIQLLNRFKAVYIDNKSQKIGLEFPINLRKEHPFIPSITIDFDGEHFIVDGKICTNNPNLNIDIGDKLNSINGKKPSDFDSYCSFLDWISCLGNQPKMIIVLQNNEVLQVDNF